MQIIIGFATSFEASKKPSPDRQKSISPSRKLVKNLVNKYGLHGESDAEAIERMSGAARVIERAMLRFLEEEKRHDAARPGTSNSEDGFEDDNMDGVDEAQDEEEESSYGVQDRL